MSIITSEYNLPRKSHRVNFPLFIEIAGKSYKAKDWSMTGVGLLDIEEEYGAGQRVEARAILPMVDSVLTLNVTLAFKTRHPGGVVGFEFVDLSPRNKRVLRHYIELAVEGRVDNLEDLVAVATTPGIRSPLEDALNLTELESEGLLKNFQKKSTFALALGALFVVAVAGLLFYNTAYRVQTVGFVAGNLERVTANLDGIVGRVDVAEKVFVDAGAPLFQIEPAHAAPAVYTVSADPLPPQDGRLLTSLREELEARRGEYDNAQQLHAERIISQKDLAIARNHFLQAQSNWLREQNRFGKRVSAADRPRANGVGPAALTVKASARGVVYGIAKRAGEYVRANEPVILIERDVKPYIVIRLLTEDALKLRIGMPSEVYVPFEDRTLDAEVTAIGHAAVNAEMTESLEGSLNETLVKIEFADPHVRLPANARVKVWIRTL